MVKNKAFKEVFSVKDNDPLEIEDLLFDWDLHCFFFFFFFARGGYCKKLLFVGILGVFGVCGVQVLYYNVIWVYN